MASNSTCISCNPACRACENDKNNCVACLYDENPYVKKDSTCSCLAGSKVDSTGNCIECEPGFYNFVNNAKRCSECPLNAVCNGGNNIQVFKGYWRPSQYSN